MKENRCRLQPAILQRTASAQINVKATEHWSLQIKQLFQQKLYH